jgi:hypothetical protein
MTIGNGRARGMNEGTLLGVIARASPRAEAVARIGLPLPPPRYRGTAVYLGPPIRHVILTSNAGHSVAPPKRNLTVALSSGACPELLWWGLRLSCLRKWSLFQATELVTEGPCGPLHLGLGICIGLQPVHFCRVFDRLDFKCMQVMKASSCTLSQARSKSILSSASS